MDAAIDNIEPITLKINGIKTTNKNTTINYSKDDLTQMHLP